MIVGMRRTLAIALAATLLVGGCARHRADAETPAPPAASSTDKSDLSGGKVAGAAANGAAANGAAANGAAADGTTAADGTGADVDQLLDEVDKQLRNDDQPAEDQD